MGLDEQPTDYRERAEVATEFYGELPENAQQVRAKCLAAKSKGDNMSFTILERALIGFLTAVEHLPHPDVSGNPQTELEAALIERSLAFLCSDSTQPCAPTSSINLYDVDEMDLSSINTECMHAIPLSAQCSLCEASIAERDALHRATHCKHDVPFELDCEACDRIFWVTADGSVPCCAGMDGPISDFGSPWVRRATLL